MLTYSILPLPPFPTACPICTISCHVVRQPLTESLPPSSYMSVEEEAGGDVETDGGLLLTTPPEPELGLCLRTPSPEVGEQGVEA